MIGDDVQVTVVDIRGDKVRLGISAPAHIPVHRKEIYEAIKQENQAKAESRGETPSSVGSLAKKKESENEKGNNEKPS